MDEEKLIRSIQNDDNRNAFAFLVRRYQSPLRGYLRNMCHGQIELADELAQESFLKAYKAINSFRFGSQFSTWLFSIARNLYFDELKSRRYLPESEKQGFQDPAMGLRLDLSKALASLPEAEREVLVLSYVEGFAHTEIAEITEVPLGTVKSRILQAKEKLMKMMSEEIGNG